MKRTFIAVPVEASENLKHLSSMLKQEFKRESMNWVEPEIMHITIRFLGDTPGDLIAPISEKLDRITEKFRFSTGRMEGLDTFSNKGKPTVLFTRLVDLPILEQMATIIDEELKTFGFLQESRGFKPHLTLARIKQIHDTKNFFNIVGNFGNSEIQKVNVEKLIFFESILLPAGPLYRPLKTIVLKKPGTI